MKKWVWMLVLTAVCGGVLGWIGNARRPRTVRLNTAILQPSTVEETVSCSGRVEESAVSEVISPADCIIAKVLVSDGQRVEKGQALYTVDKDATLSALAHTDGALAVKTAMTAETPSEVTAPVAGVVTALPLSAGDLAQKDTACATIASNEPVQIRLSVPERCIRRIAVGQKAAISGMGFSKDLYNGVITEIAPVAKQEVSATGSETMVEAVAALQDDADDSLRVGLTAKAAITVSTAKDAYIVPYDAVLEDTDSREYCYIYYDGSVEKRIIEPKAELGSGYLVETGLAAGEQLVLNPEKVTARAIYTAGEETDA